MACQWYSLPAELHLDVVSRLDIPHLRKMAQVDRTTHRLCLPSLYKAVKFESREQLDTFLTTVPAPYRSFIHDLTVVSSSNLPQLLEDCSHLDRLSITADGCPPLELISIFPRLPVRSLSLVNSAMEDENPLSERFVVSLAHALPKLEDLSLTRVTRSSIHAPELLGSCVPLVYGDDNIPPHPTLGDQLRLPSLLKIPTLKKLKIRDTHLGDSWWDPRERPERWGATSGKLHILDVGGYGYVSPQANQEYTQRILSNVDTITDFSLGSCLVYDKCAPPPPSFSSLRTLHLTPLVPTSDLHATLDEPHLSSSPVHTLSFTFHTDDAVEGCTTLEAFLSQRRRRRSASTSSLKYPSLRKVAVTFAASVDDNDLTDCPSPSMFRPGSRAHKEHLRKTDEAKKRLGEVCRRVGIDATIDGVAILPPPPAHVHAHAHHVHQRGRANTY